MQEDRKIHSKKFLLVDHRSRIKACFTGDVGNIINYSHSKKKKVHAAEKKERGRLI